jgi:hypothetical protein
MSTKSCFRGIEGVYLHNELYIIHLHIYIYIYELVGKMKHPMACYHDASREHNFPNFIRAEYAPVYTFFYHKLNSLQLPKDQEE